MLKQIAGQTACTREMSISCRKGKRRRLAGNLTSSVRL